MVSFWVACCLNCNCPAHRWNNEVAQAGIGQPFVSMLTETFRLYQAAYDSREPAGTVFR